MTPSPAPRFEVRFESLSRDASALAFPCDREGHVDLDALSDRARGNYLFARALIGMRFAAPAVIARSAADGLAGGRTG